LNATGALGQGECGEPQPDLEIQDSEHRVLKTLPMGSLLPMTMCMGHGWGPSAIAKGTAQHEFRELSTAPPPSPPGVTPIPSILPGPGVYDLVSVWSPRVLDTSKLESNGVLTLGAGQLGGVYDTARSLPVRIEVVPSTDP